MNEQVLRAIIKLLVTSVKIDGLQDEERQSVENFLRENIRGNAVKKYLEEFDNLVSTINTDFPTALEVCSQINRELNRKQKIIVLLHLIDLAFSDKNLSEREEAFDKQVAEELFIEVEIYEAIKNFVTTKDIYELSSLRILIIDDNESSREAHFKHFKKNSFGAALAVLRLPEDEIYFIRTSEISNEEVTLNGKILNPSYAYPLIQGSVIRTEKSDPIYFSTITNYFYETESAPQLTFEAKDINFFFKSGHQGLHDINIIEKSGNLIALMGASGSGKSTLLSVLNGNKKPHKGHVLINSISIHEQQDQLRGVIGYVPQDDLLIEELTVFENLYYAAKLCFADTADKEIEKLVLKTLQSLGLVETKDLKVGSVLDKTISGGQRKRVNIGLELLREPAVMFVDEPTSGLSSRDSENIMDILKELAISGKLIFVVIHQPSSDIFKLFDKLVILDTGGYQIYYGNPLESLVYFKTLTNQVNADQSLCNVCGTVNPEVVFDIIDSKVIDEYGHVTGERKHLPTEWRDFYLEKNILPELIPTHEKPENTLKIPNKGKQFFVFLIRDLLSKLSNTQYLVINLLQAPLLACILGYIVRFYRMDDLTNKGSYIFSENPNIPPYIFMSIIVSLFMGLTISAEEIIRDAKIMKREKFLHLSRTSYLFAKIAILFSFSAIQSLLYTIVGNWIVGIEGMTFIYWAVLFSTSCFANMLGLNISQTFKSVITIYILIPILLIPQLILGGIVVRFDQVNPNMHSQDKTPIVGDIMASRWSFEALMVSQFMYNKFEKQFYNFDQQLAFSDYKKTYYIPTLFSKLEYCKGNLRPSDENFIKNISLLRNEIYKELEENQTIKFPEVDNLTPENFNLKIAKATEIYLHASDRYYNKIYNNSIDDKDDLIASLTSTPADNKIFLEKKKEYQNARVENFVTSDLSDDRIVEYNGRLIRKIYPIYFKPENSKSPINFRTHFFAPYKYFFTILVPTLYFNIANIWLMCLLLYITLYYKVFNFLINKASGEVE